MLYLKICSFVSTLLDNFHVVWIFNLIPVVNLGKFLTFAGVAIDAEASLPLMPLSLFTLSHYVLDCALCWCVGRTASVGEGILPCCDEHWAFGHTPGLGTGSHPCCFLYFSILNHPYLLYASLTAALLI